MTPSQRLHRLHELNQKEAKAQADRTAAFYHLLAVVIVLSTSIAAVVIAS